MKIADTKSDALFRVRVNRTGRRTFSHEYKAEIVEECSAPGVSVAAVALAHQINANLLRKWIVQHRAGRRVPGVNATRAMLPVTLESTSRSTLAARPETVPPAPSRAAPGVIEIELETARVRVRGAVDAAALRIVLEALAKR